MSTRVVFTDDDFLEYYKANFSDYIDFYKNQNKKAILDVVNKHIYESDISFNYQPLKTSVDSENPERDNIKIVYHTLKELTPTQAVEEKLWFAMYHKYYLDELLQFIADNINHKKINAKIESAIFFKHGRQRSLIVQNIARKWWLGYYFYDEENEDDPYHLLNFYTDSQDIIGKSTSFLSSNLTNNKDLLLGIVEGIQEACDQGLIKNVRSHYVEANKMLNIKGGIMILDAMDRASVKNLIFKHIEGGY